ncbi:polysaccharide deacetylase family protein [Cohnella massiliensis]|uniref:polysaccharide deacetylase family protein n=1 Tax=Cohnella massiliensis TaxID=1816691 RepID=UPI0009BA8976|nr:polysaccharide deacetylase family protein [Cohnella massiliensis]
MRTTSPIRLAALLVCLAALLAAGRYGPIAPYVQAVKSDKTASIAFGGLEKTDAGPADLAEWIKAEAPKLAIPPVDAKIDRVWKAIPGYNGREVDIDATLARAKELGLGPGGEPGRFPWVFRELEPAVQLDQLEPAPVYRGNPNKPMVGLMINVAWGDEYLPSMLKTLADEKAKATFFFDGTWLSKNLDKAREIVKAGHEASNHAYTHPNMSRLGAERQRSEIAKTEALLRDGLGTSNKWFAPPSGDFNELTVRTASGLGLRTVLWTLDTIDWKKPPASGVVAKVSAQAEPGTLILMHPTSTTEQALAGIIRAVREKGLEPGTVTDTLSSARTEDRPAA